MCIMNHTQARSVEGRSDSFLQRLMNPTVDRTIAVVAILPMLWSAYYRYQHFGLNLPVIYYFVSTFVVVLTMVFRRAPKRITANPWFWLLAFVNTYFPQAILPFMDRGQPVISPLLSNVIAIAASRSSPRSAMHVPSTISIEGKGNVGAALMFWSVRLRACS